jgi:hypothetical protein
VIPMVLLLPHAMEPKLFHCLVERSKHPSGAHLRAVLFDVHLLAKGNQHVSAEFKAKVNKWLTTMEHTPVEQNDPKADWHFLVDYPAHSAERAGRPALHGIGRGWAP